MSVVCIHALVSSSPSLSPPSGAMKKKKKKKKYVE